MKWFTHSLLTLSLIPSSLTYAAREFSTYPAAPPTYTFKKSAPAKGSSDPSKPAEIGLHLTQKEVAPHLFLITHTFPYPANAALIEMANKELVLVDTTFFNDSAEDLLIWIEKKFGKRKITAIDTHFHTDRIGGNGALIKHKIPVWGSDQIGTLLKSKGAEMKTVMEGLSLTDDMKGVFTKQKLVAPDHTFPLKEGKTLKFGDEEVQIKFVGAGHTSDNVVVYFPTQQILVGGSLIIAGKTVGNTMHADLKEWPKSVKALSELKVKQVIAGRGPETGPQLIEHTLQVLNQTEHPVESKFKYKHRKVVIAPL